MSKLDKILEQYGEYDVKLVFYGGMEASVELGELVNAIIEKARMSPEEEALEAIKAIYDDESLDEVDRDNAVFEVLEGLK